MVPDRQLLRVEEVDLAAELHAQRAVILVGRRDTRLGVGKDHGGGLVDAEPAEQRVEIARAVAARLPGGVLAADVVLQAVPEVCVHRHVVRREHVVVAGKAVAGLLEG